MRRYFPAAKVIPALLRLCETLFAVKLERVEEPLWAPGVEEYAVVDGGKPIAWVFLDLLPRPGKMLRPAYFQLRAGHGEVRPLAAIIGNGPAAFAHQDLVELFHEFGHLMHGALSTAPFATLQAVREDFVEAPSQMFENWAWDAAVLKRIAPDLPDSLAARILAVHHVADGVFWTRQAALGLFDLSLHTTGGDPAKAWDDAMRSYTAVPPERHVMPVASFVPIMGGYDAGYYGYLWSRVYAADLFSAFEGTHVFDPEVGLRFRREVLAPGGMSEPDELVRNFLGRPVDPRAFYRELGLRP